MEQISSSSTVAQEAIIRLGIPDCLIMEEIRVIHFLLSNLKYWMKEFHFDGFRFDGVTSMLYLDRGLGTSFDNYDKYFSMNTDIEAITYLTLANELIHEVNPNAMSIRGYVRYARHVYSN